MSFHGSHVRERRRARGRRPIIEPLEGRELPSSHPLGPALPGGHYPAHDVGQFVPILYPPGTPQPTPAEVRRESFVLKGTGRYTFGPAGFSNQSITIRGYGKKATSNLSRVMRFQFVISEPSASSPIQAVTGAITFAGGNFLQNGTMMMLDIAGPKGTEVNGLPTRLNWAMDADGGGPFAGPGAAFPAYSNFPGNYFNSSGVPTSPLSQGLPPTSVNNWGMGLGELSLHYVPDRRPRSEGLGAGRVVIVLHGLLNLSGAQGQANKNIN